MSASVSNPDVRIKNRSRGSLLVLPALVALGTFVLGLFITNARSATFSLDNLFIHANWRHGLTALETVFDPMIFWGEIGFSTCLACVIAAAWIHRVPNGGEHLRIGVDGTRKLFMVSLVVTGGLLILMAILLFSTIPDPTASLAGWWPTQASYQAPALPAIIATVVMIAAPMKKYKKKPENAARVEGTTAVIMVAAAVSWLASCIPTWWHPRGLFHFNFQLQFILGSVAFPVSIGLYLLTFLLKEPPAVGDGARHLQREIIFLISAVSIMVAIQVAGVFANGTGAPGQIFDLDIYWWWPVAHLIPYIFIVALAFSIITGVRLLASTRPLKMPSKLAKMRRLPDIVRKTLVVACIAIFIIPPVAGYALDDEDPPRVLVNQVGYAPSAPKRVLFQAPAGSSVPESAPFMLVDDATGGIVHSGMLRKNGSYYQHWYMEGNFTAFNDTGRYHVEASVNGAKVISPSFTIAENVYDIPLERAVEFFYYQRCGYEVEDVVPGFAGHEVCHLDDAMFFNGSGLVYKNLTGGWHDAGDYNKYNSWYYTQWRVTRALADAWLDDTAAYIGFPDRYDSAAPDIIDEMLWGARYLIKCVDAVGIAPATRGLVIHNVADWNWNENKSAHTSYWGPPDRNTDNVPSTGDERVVHTGGKAAGVPWGWAGSEAGFGFAGAMLRVARIINTTGYTLPSWAPTSLELRDIAALLNETYRPIADANEGTKLNGTGWPHMWTAMARLLYEQEVARITGNWDTADDWAHEILEHVTDDFGNSNNVHFLSDVLRYYLSCNRTIPALAITKINSWQSTIFPSHFVGPFGVFHVFNSSGDPVLFSRDAMAGGGLINADHCWFAWFQSLASHVVPGSARLDIVQNILDYLFGVNPLGLCQMDGVGGQSVPQIHHRYAYTRNPTGRVPGGIINGIRSYQPSKQWAELQGVNETTAATLLPENAWVDNWPGSGFFNDGVSAHSNEIWIIHNGAFLEMLTSFMKYHA